MPIRTLTKRPLLASSQCMMILQTQFRGKPFRTPQSYKPSLKFLNSSKNLWLSLLPMVLMVMIKPQPHLRLSIFILVVALSMLPVSQEIESFRRTRIYGSEEQISLMSFWITPAICMRTQTTKKRYNSTSRARSSTNSTKCISLRSFQSLRAV